MKELLVWVSSTSLWVFVALGIACLLMMAFERGIIKQIGIKSADRIFNICLGSCVLSAILSILTYLVKFAL